MRPMMDAGDLAELDGIEHERDVTVPGQPDSVVLILHFRAPRTGSMAADIHDSGRAFVYVLWQVEIAGDIQARHTLKHDILNAVILAFEYSGDARVQRRL